MPRDFSLSASPIYRLSVRNSIDLTPAKVGAPLDRGRLTVMDYAAAMAQGDKWERLYRKIISTRR